MHSTQDGIKKVASTFTSLQEKLDILRVVKENPTHLCGKRIDTVKELGLTPSTLNSIVAKRSEIKYTWVFHTKVAAGVNFNGTILQEKALDIVDKLRIDGFTVSNRWIARFKNRHGIRYCTMNDSHEGDIRVGCCVLSSSPSEGLAHFNSPKSSCSETTDDEAHTCGVWGTHWCSSWGQDLADAPLGASALDSASAGQGRQSFPTTCSVVLAYS
ncbi:hypothetical protein HPB50_025730 [Hyalomma asiaticum]|uniref:Uncharacterized protein n=1 Tax=Hyalomma asiaticum TaxID=266040 RepID=A0ACB7RQE2_HYAAI|nr:hypothetical protein HPB50_025730 [Hyalomma asiaticum]